MENMELSTGLLLFGVGLGCLPHPWVVFVGLPYLLFYIVYVGMKAGE